MLSNTRVVNLINSVADMYLAHKNLNIYLKYKGDYYKLGRDESDWTLTQTDLHLMHDPCILVG